MFFYFFDFIYFFKKFLKNSYILYLQALIISIGPNLVYSCFKWCYKQTIYWFVNFKIFSDFSQMDSWNLCHLKNVVLNFPIYGLMIIDWNNLTDLVFDQTFLEIYISLNNSLMQGSYSWPKNFLIFFKKKKKFDISRKLLEVGFHPQKLSHNDFFY